MMDIPQSVEIPLTTTLLAMFKEPKKSFAALAVIVGGLVIWVLGPDYIAAWSDEGTMLWIFGEWVEWLARIFGFIVVMVGAYLFVRAM